MKLRVKFYNLILISLLIYFNSEAQQYNFKNYTTKNGLAGATVNAIFQDSRGFIWFGAEGGVSRFDGKIFKNFTKKDGLVASDVTCISEDKSGNIWIGTSEGVSLYDGIHFKNYTTNKGLSNNSIRCIYVDGKNTVWFASDKKGISKYNGKIFQKITKQNGLSSDTVYAITQDKKDNYWFATNNGVSKYDGNRIVNFSSVPELNKKEFFSILADSKGNIWFGGTTGYGVMKYDGQKFSKFNLPKEVDGDFIASITEDKKQNIWFATQHGIVKYDGSNFTQFNENNGLSSNTVYAICNDNENNLWIGTLGGGVNLFNNESFITYTDKHGLSTNKIYCVSKNSNDELLVGTAGFGINVLNKNGFAPVNFIAGLSTSSVYSIARNSNGEYWVGTDNSGVFVLEKHSNNFRVIKHFEKSNSNLIIGVMKIIFDKHGNTYIGTYGSGLFIINGENEIKNYSVKDGFPSDNILTMYQDSKGIIWIGTLDAGVIKYEKGKFKNYSEKEGLSNKEVWSITEDDNHIMYFGTREGGISCYNGSKFKTISSKEGLCSDYIETLIWDDIDKCLWAGTDKGINKIKLTRDLKINSPVRYYGEQEGFKGIEVNQNALYQDNEGIIWMGTNNGLCAYNRKFDFPNTAVPRVYIDEIRLGNQKVDWKKYSDSVDERTNTPKNLVLSYKNNHLTFNFQALTTDNVKYQYILEGQDNEWTPFSISTEANFTNITPGKKYKFRVKAVNSSGVWSKDDVSFSFTISSPWWQTWWFYTIAGSVIIVSLYSFVRYRTTKLLKDKKQLEDKVEERTTELKVANIKISHTLKEKEDSIEYAKRIQYSLLAHKDLLKDNLKDYFVLFKPKDVVSGDFYWALQKEDSFYFAACDSTGHGVPGAFMSLLNISFMNEAINEKNLDKPNEVFDYVRNKLIKNTQGGNDGMDATLIRIKQNKISYASAFNKPLIIRNNEIINLPSDRMPVGKGEMMAPFTLHSPEVKEGDTLYLFTDGFCDQFGGEKDTKFTPKRLKEILLNIQTLSMEQQSNHLNSVFDKWKGNKEQTDDILIVGIRF